MTSTQKGRRRPDRRVIRTRKAIMKSFDTLICAGNFDKINVSAIAREADIDRKTFYLHYRSIDDLINAKTEETVGKLLDKLKDEKTDKPHLERVHYMLAEINSVIMENIEMCTIIAERVSTDQVLNRLAKATEPAMERAGLDPDITSNQQLYMKMQFFIAGAIYLYTSWLRSDRQQPIESVSDAIEETITMFYQQDTLAHNNEGDTAEK